MAHLFTCASAAAATLIAIAGLIPAQTGYAQMISRPAQSPTPEAPHPYTGMWVTGDGYIRHELLPDGRYDEARGARQSAYQGRYEIRGSHIDYWDDTGFTADGEFIDGVLHHAGMILYREE